MLCGESHEGVLGLTWCESSDGGDEGEEEVFDDEAPGEEADDGADLVSDDGGDAHSDCGPDDDPGERSEQEEGDENPRKTSPAVNPLGSCGFG